MESRSKEKLVRLLEHARDSTPHYSRLIPRSLELCPENILTVLESLPCLSRADLRKESLRLRSNRGDATSWRTVRSTGTTGEPVEVILDAGARAAEVAALLRHLDRVLGPDRRRDFDLIHATLHAGSASRAMRAPFSPDSRAVKWNLLRLWNSDRESFQRGLRHLNGQVVTMLPSVAELLATRFLETKTAAVRPVIVLLSGEMLTPETAQAVRGAFQCPVSSLYTLAEIGIVGMACGECDGSYHIEEEAVYFEILDDEGRAVDTGRRGEVVVTALQNSAMPLIRYRTGDRARWLKQKCGCGTSAPRFRLDSARRPSRIVQASGAAVNVIRFNKLFAALDVDQIQVDQIGADHVRVRYRGKRPLNLEARSLVESALRGALGPQLEVEIQHLQPGSRMTRSAAARAGPVRDSGESPTCESVEKAEPEGPTLQSVVPWLRSVLGGLPGLEIAVVTGSSLDPGFSTRFSDVDLVILVDENPPGPPWIELSRDLIARWPKLSVNVDQLSNLPRRAPLMACRLLCEHVTVIGELTPDRLPWPNLSDLESQARYWAQDAACALRHRLFRLHSSPLDDPVREAWRASKFALDALRFRYLLRGERETAARWLLERISADAGLESDWVAEFQQTFRVAREHVPPPLPGVETNQRFLLMSIEAVRMAADKTTPGN